MDMEQYNQKRKAIIKEYRLKKLKITALVLGIALAFGVAVWLVGGSKLQNMPVVIVVLLIDLLFSILYLAVRLTQISHRQQTVLLQFEDEQLLRKY
ncbi:MAG: hypothetical protein IJ043_10390 [Clostridia bacterium]|nr:hypothetical protein [Clostridia bacterium]